MKGIKKIVALVLALTMIFALAACGSSSSSSKDRLAQIKEKGYIELCTEPYFAPYEFIDPSKTGDDQYVGVDIEIAQYIADKIGVELKITPLDFTAVLAGIVDGKYDMAISAIAYSPTRAESMALSDVYEDSETGFGFLVRAEDVDKYTSIESLKDAVVITQSGSVQEGLYNQYVTESKEFKLVANMTDGYLAVAENKADVCICNVDGGDLYAQANGGLATTSFRFTVDPNMNGTVVALPNDGNSDSLMEVVNEAIAELKEQGLVAQWVDEYTAYAATLGIN
jgi:polar amino acid transport system substrate-binding protein